MANPLARVIMEKDLKIQPRTSSKLSRVGSNLGSREKELISDIINCRKEVVEGTKINRAITLDEAVNRMKNNR